MKKKKRPVYSNDNVKCCYCNQIFTKDEFSQHIKSNHSSACNKLFEESKRNDVYDVPGLILPGSFESKKK